MVAAVGLYFLCNNTLAKELTSWICIFGAAPFVFIGFFSYNGLSAEEYAFAWFKTHILCGDMRVYSAENYLYDIIYSNLEEWSNHNNEEE
jgi:hypothetical protein